MYRQTEIAITIKAINMTTVIEAMLMIMITKTLINKILRIQINYKVKYGSKYRLYFKAPEIRRLLKC